MLIQTNQRMKKDEERRKITTLAPTTLYATFRFASFRFDGDDDISIQMVSNRNCKVEREKEEHKVYAMFDYRKLNHHDPFVVLCVPHQNSRS